MKLAIAAAVALLAFAGTAQAGGDSNQKLCAKSWSSVQSESGGSFSSISECASSRGVFAPILSSSPAAVTAGERFTLTATGFHADAHSTVSFAITGQSPYSSYVPYYPTDANGSFVITFVFAECRKTDTGNEVSVDLTLTFTDSFGVHASTRVTLC